MKTNTTIQISISNPCTENWDEMTASDKGRFCAHCKKQVIDFTRYTDADLHRFLSSNAGNLCGRFYSDQLRRDITLPSQPHSKLYRMAIALGLTLIITNTPSYARKNPPLVEQTDFDKPLEQAADTIGPAPVIKGIVLDERKEGAIYATVRLIDSSETSYGMRTGVLTDTAGRFTIQLTADQAMSKQLYLQVSYIGYKQKTVLVPFVNRENEIKIVLDAGSMQVLGGFTTTIVRRPKQAPLPDQLAPMNTTITGEDLKHMGGN